MVDWPIGRRDRAARLLVAGGGLAAVVAGVVSQSVGMGLLSLAAINLAIWRVWVPVTFRFGPRGIDQTYLRRHHCTAWTAIARFEVARDAVVFYPDPGTAPLAALRGLRVRTLDRHDEIVAQARFYVPDKAEPNETNVRATHALSTGSSSPRGGSPTGTA